ncbi:colipase-like [Scleropages formosus]|uniref:colipase-like n=1 Tax=Scleropages formosus TaxID=113540 RepID=UPI0006360F42|nr:colipase [Scleropages formosus]
MRSAWLIAVCVLASALAAPSKEKGLIINLDNGELCVVSMQCKSSCCHRQDGLSLARCAPRSAENAKCSPKTLYGTYYHCTCENGLKCDTDITIDGSITNTNFGICRDPSEMKTTA